MSDWDSRFLDHAAQVASWSKDPSTKVGSVIVDPNTKQIISSGFNGFPKKVEDKEERYNDRELKYKYIVHAEANAIIYAQRSLEGCTLYCVPFMPCCRCAGLIIQAGIKRVVSYSIKDERWERWWESDFKHSVDMFKEAGVELILLDKENES